MAYTPRERVMQVQILAERGPSSPRPLGVASPQDVTGNSAIDPPNTAHKSLKYLMTNPQGRSDVLAERRRTRKLCWVGTSSDLE